MFLNTIVRSSPTVLWARLPENAVQIDYDAEKSILGRHIALQDGITDIAKHRNQGFAVSPIELRLYLPNREINIAALIYKDVSECFSVALVESDVEAPQALQSFLELPETPAEVEVLVDDPQRFRARRLARCPLCHTIIQKWLPMLLLHFSYPQASP